MNKKFISMVLLSVFSSASMANPQLEIVAKLTTRPANPAVSDTGRVFFSQHPLDGPAIKVVELLKNGDIKPFPNVEFNRELGNVIGIKVVKDTLWLLDMGSDKISPQLVSWNISNNKLKKKIPIPASVRRDNSFLQDMAIDTQRQIAYIADMTRGDLIGVSEPAIIAVDLVNGETRRLLENHPTFAPGEAMKIDLRVIAHASENGKITPLQLGLNPIAISPDNQWVYYGSVNGKVLWRIASADLANRAMSASTLSGKPERYASKGNSDGIIADDQGNVYVTDVEQHGIGIANSNGYHLLVEDKKLLNWADGLAMGPDGYIYATVNQLHKHPALNSGVNDSNPPYYLVKFRPK